jgi:hypothetical protein
MTASSPQIHDCPTVDPCPTSHGPPHSVAHANSSRDSPDIDRIGHGAALSDMGYEYNTAVTL